VRRVYSAPTTVPVDTLRALLEAEGIHCLVKNRHLSMTVGEVPPIETWPSLWVVDDARRAEAERLVAEILADDGEGQAPWRCERCGEEIDGRFAACWQCDGGDDGSIGPDPVVAETSDDYAALGRRIGPAERLLLTLAGIVGLVWLLVYMARHQ
jgi:hypothetical protein